MADKGVLKIHIERVHEGKRPHTCDRCDKKFSHRYQVKRHIAAFHEQKRPFQCTICRKSFLTSRYLKKHGDVHSNVRPYACTICEDKFKRHPHLVTHLKTIHDVAKKDGQLCQLDVYNVLTFSFRKP